MAARWRILLTIFLAVLVLDQATKFWAVGRLTRIFDREQAETLGEQVQTWLQAEKLERLRQRPVVVHREHLRFRYVENPGAAWGMFGGMEDRHRVPFFFVVSTVAITFLLLFFRRLPENQRLLQVALALVLGGAVGNFVDRILRGYVIDFIDLHWKNDPRLHWPTFNIADIGISVGVALLLSYVFFGKHPQQEEEQVQPPAPEPLQRDEPPRYVEIDQEPAAATAEELFPERSPAALRSVRADGTIETSSPTTGSGGSDASAAAGNLATASSGSGQAGPSDDTRKE